jgi:hypothetical protein
MNQLVAFHGKAITGHLNVADMVRHYLAPYDAAEPFDGLIETVRMNSTPARRSKNQRRSAAIEIRRAVAGHTKAIRRAQSALGIAMLAPDEEDVRQILALMFSTFQTPPSATSMVMIDTLIMELMADDIDRPFCSPAIMAACRECWREHTSPPSIAAVLKAAKVHQRRLEAVFQQLGDVLEASQWADDVVEPDEPVDESDEDYIPIEA